MKFSTLSAIILCASFVITVGCDTPVAKKESTKSGSHVHADGSVHSDDHGHDHEGHDHGVGPHDGTLADWGGGKYHVEFTVDHDKQEATVYILGSDEKSSAAIDAKEITLTIKEPAMTVSLTASPLDSEVMGGASRFVGTHEGLGTVMEYEGSISGVVEETPYSGNFKEEPHGH